METNEIIVAPLNAQIKTNTNERESGLELLRIIAMIFIIMHHSVGINPLVNSQFEISLRYILIQNGKLGVDIFILISSYFMINKNLTIKHILKIVLPTWFYSVTLYLISVILHVNVFILREFITFLFPICFGHWWFISCYIFLLFLTPLLNMFIKSLNKKKHTIICIVLLVLEMILPYFKLIITGKFEAFPYSNEIVLFCVLYFIGSYFRLYNFNVNGLILFVISLFIFLIFKIFLPLFGLKTELFNLNSIGNMFLSIYLFLFFNKLKFKNKIINRVASTTFGIYLIHEHQIFKRIIWNIASDMIISYVSNIVFVYIFSILFVFIFCMLIDLVRQMTVHKVALKVENKLLNRKTIT